MNSKFNHSQLCLLVTHAIETKQRIPEIEHTIFSYRIGRYRRYLIDLIKERTPNIEVALLNYDDQVSFYVYDVLKVPRPPSLGYYYMLQYARKYLRKLAEGPPLFVGTSLFHNNRFFSTVMINE